MEAPRHTSQRDDAVGATSTRVTRSRSARQTGPPLFHSDGESSLSRGDHSNSSSPMPPPTTTSPEVQNATSKRKADTPESASESAKAPRIGNGPPSREQSLRQTTIPAMFSNTQSDAPSNKPPKCKPPKRKPPKRKPSKVVSSHGKAPKGTLAKDKASKNKEPDRKSPGPPDGGGGGNPSDTASDSDPQFAEKPLRNIREIVKRLIDDASQSGLSDYTDSKRKYYIRVGTLCSGTDAPIHVMNLFAMLKNPDGEQVFTTINCFGCEIEPFKQSFLMRNSKPGLLFKDARDFAEDDAKRA